MSADHVPWKRLTLEIDSRLEAVSVLCQVVHLMCIAAAFAPVEASEVEVCVAEAINNAIQHAYHGDPTRRVKLELVMRQNELVVDVSDSGTSGDAAVIQTYHHQALENQPGPVQSISERGRGLAVIHQVMDSVEYAPGEQQNRLRMIKRRSAAPRRPSPQPVNWR